MASALASSDGPDERRRGTPAGSGSARMAASTWISALTGARGTSSHVVREQAEDPLTDPADVGWSLSRRVLEWWEQLTFGNPRPARTVGALAALGVITGFGEAAVVLLLVSLAAGGGASGLPGFGLVPDDPAAVAAVTLGVVAVLAAAHVGSALLSAHAGAGAQRGIRQQLVDAYLAASWPVVSGAPQGDLQEVVITNANQVANGMQQSAAGVSSLLNLVAVVIAAVVVSPWSTLGLVFVVVSVLAVARPLRARTRRATRRLVAEVSALATDVAETADTAADVRVFGVTATVQESLHQRIDAAARTMAAVRSEMSLTPSLIRDATIALVAIGVAVAVSGGGVSLPVLGATVLLLLRALGHAQAVSAVAHQLTERTANLERLRSRLDVWRASTPAAGTVSCPRVAHLRLVQVSFGYPGAEKPALDRLDLDVVRGELLGIVGRTGAGKTTLSRIVLGLLTPDTGEVLIDRVPRDEIDPADWHRRIAWVPQEPRLLRGSIADNVRFLRPDITDEAVRQAVTAAGLAGEVDAWPEGLDHPVGPAGGSLSGGQRQRVALARALAGAPDLLVLDEPTSSLDVHTEVAVRDAITNERDHAAVVVIAHRLSTLATCDRVAVVDQGRIVALGKPDRLAAEDRYYQEALALSGLRP